VKLGLCSSAFKFEYLPGQALTLTCQCPRRRSGESGRAPQAAATPAPAAAVAASSAATLHGWHRLDGRPGKDRPMAGNHVTAGDGRRGRHDPAELLR
jgi:hypothetical protein